MSPTSTTNSNGNFARGLSLILGVWLFISAFIWPHTAAEQTNTWIVAILIFAAAAIAMAVPAVRYANTVLAIYLFISSWTMPHQNAGTLWNNLIVAVVVFLLSLVPSAASHAFGRPAHA